LIDCHVHVIAAHLNLNVTANQPNVFATLRALPIMKGMLMRGFTTVRDAGGGDWNLAEATRTDMVEGPRILPRAARCRKPEATAMAVLAAM